AHSSRAASADDPLDRQRPLGRPVGRARSARSGTGGVGAGDQTGDPAAGGGRSALLLHRGSGCHSDRPDSGVRAAAPSASITSAATLTLRPASAAVALEPEARVGSGGGAGRPVAEVVPVVASRRATSGRSFGCVRAVAVDRLGG